MPGTDDGFEGKVALVTGAASGIGFAIAEALGRQGVRIGLNDLRAVEAEKAVKTLREAGSHVIPLIANVASASGAASTINELETEFGRIDIVVNNAGVLRATKLENISEDEWDYVINGNLKSTFLCCREAVPALRRAGGGSIINVSSSAGKSVSTIGGAHYTAGKAAVLGLTRHLARELASQGIRVNAVCPGLIDTDMVRSTIPEERIRAYAESFPARRLGLPSEVANLVVFLASKRASYMTGTSCDVNGGDLTI